MKLFKSRPLCEGCGRREHDVVRIFLPAREMALCKDCIKQIRTVK